MKVFVNYPDNTSELEHNLATFHAKLLLKEIDNQNISDTSKKKLLNSIVEHLKDK